MDLQKPSGTSKSLVYIDSNKNQDGCMKTQIHTIPLGMSNVYLLKGDKSVLIDAGVTGLKRIFLRGLVTSISE